TRAPNLAQAPQERPARYSWRVWVIVPIYVLALLPLVFTIIDVTFGTGLWYTGIAGVEYQGGYLASTIYNAGLLASALKGVNTYFLGLVVLGFLAYISVSARGSQSRGQMLAWMLLAFQIITLLLVSVLRNVFPEPAAPYVLTSAALSLVYGYAAFQQMISERRLQQGRLAPRLVGLVLVIAVPLLAAVAGFISVRAATLLEPMNLERLERLNYALGDHIETWLDFNNRALSQMVAQSGITSMDPVQQKPILEAMAGTYPYMYLVSTTDLTGLNVARNDDVAPLDYSDRAWFQNARDGRPWTQVLIGRTSGVPAWVASQPIRNADGDIVGVGMFASTLEDLSALVAESVAGATGISYVVDAQGMLIMHSVIQDLGAEEVRDFSDYPPVTALLAGDVGALQFADAEDLAWRAYTSTLDNGWGIVVQIPETELLASLMDVRALAFLVIALGIVLLSVLSGLAVRQAFLPLTAMTVAVAEITAGDLAQEVPVESADEIGMLAQGFNAMVARLREMFGSLEQQVNARTFDLERRAAYLQASAEVSRATTSILDPEQLISQAVDLIRERFGLYYVGLFLVDHAGEWAVLRAGTGGAGRMMLARQHRLAVGPGSMVGWSIQNAAPRIALEAGEDAVRLATPELPETRSEAAIPLRSRETVIGALTVQHHQAGAFDDDAIAALQTMADQLAVALENARLLAQSREALEAARHAYRQVSQQAWDTYLKTRSAPGYRYSRITPEPVSGDWNPEMLRAFETASPVETTSPVGTTLTVPVMVRGQPVGVIAFRKAGYWDSEQRRVITSLVEELGQTLESARLYEETQRRVAEEQMVGRVATRVRESLDLDVVLQAAARELQDVLDLSRVEIRLGAPDIGAGPEAESC
ncbi:MAG: GAF domain-containing protein, partial [Anaerolineae bacterium]|nr:GAF domain-containing protein [Anaerolineae bacterium]